MTLIVLLVGMTLHLAVQPIDRIVTSGSVVDFMNVGIGPVRTGIFNVADVIIAIGVLMLFSTLFSRRKKVEAADGRLSSSR